MPEGVTEVEVLIVAGGGGGGSRHGGGGGAGGLIFESNYLVTPGTPISIKVGAGGLGAVGGTQGSGFSGENSFFGTLEAIGGGFGSGQSGVNGGDGGSGGGVRGNTLASGGTSLSNQGYDGGSGISSCCRGGGGGGAGGGGGGAAGLGDGSGGIGLYFGDVFGDKYGENGWFAGGGGAAEGADGGLGGGGAGGSGGVNNNGEAGMPNTGGGGGGGGSRTLDGSSSGWPGKPGGSGIVLVKYKKVNSNLQVSSLNSGLIGHWSLSEVDYNPSTFRVSDLTPYSNHGTNHGATFTTDRFGKEGGAIDFKIGDYIHIGRVYDWNESVSSTWSAWIYHKDQETEGNRSRGGIISVDASFGSSYGLYWGSGDAIIDFSTRAIGGSGGYNAYQVPKNQWVHILGVYDAKNSIKKLYSNGILVYQAASGGTGNTSSNIRIFAKRVVTTGDDYNVPFKISDARLYNRALSEQEISQLYNLYKPKITPNLQKGLVLDMPLTLDDYNPSTERVNDRTPYDNHGVNNGSIINNDGAEFDNEGEVIEIRNHGDNLNLNENLTISVWVNWFGNRDSDKRDGVRRSAILKNRRSTSGGWSGTGYGLVDVRNNSIRFSIHDGNTWVSRSIPILANEWTHIVATLDENYLNGYVNGVFSSNSSRNEINPGIGNEFNIGKGQSYWDTFNGQISNVRIYNRALSAEEIELLYARGR